jgi:hypothetical protein
MTINADKFVVELLDITQLMLIPLPDLQITAA